MKKKKFKAYHAVFLLLLITIGASLAAFFWLTSIEKHVEHKDIVITDIAYNQNTNELSVKLINGLNTIVPIKSDGKPTEQTVITIYSDDAELDCEFVPLNMLACKGDCDTEIEPGKKAIISLGSGREKCLLSKDANEYHLSIFFGLRAPISKEFHI